MSDAVRSGEAPIPAAAPTCPVVWRDGRLGRFLAHPSLVIGCAVLLVLALVAIFAPFIAPNSPTRTSLINTYAAPSWRFPLGTDQFGRCVLSRIVYGSRVSLEVALAVVAISLSLGTLVGAIAGYAGGWVQRVVVMANGVWKIGETARRP